jgi:LCP family protein required for cell wall assembly
MTSVQENLRTGMRAARAGRMAEARAAFQSVLDEEPVNETALLWLGYLAEDPHTSLSHITQAMEAHLQSPRAYAALRWAWRRVADSSLQLSPEADGVAAASPPSSVLPGARHVIGRLSALGAVLLLVAMVGWTVGLPLLADAPAMAALASAPLDSPPPTAESVAMLSPVPSIPSTMPSPIPVASPTGTSVPTLDPSPTPSPTPIPAPSPTPSPVPLVVPEPFPVAGPNTVVPSTTLPIPTPVQPVPVAADAVNIVVLGSDQRPDWSEWHTDVVQVVSVQRDQGVISVISVPRDLYLYIPGFWMSRINFADFYGEAYDYEGGGPALVRDTLLYNLGIRVDYYVRTNFDGLIGIVDTMDGVDIPVPCSLSDYWPYPDENGEYQILAIEPGMHHMDGEHALWYSRSRKTTSVFSRERRQQQVLQALWHKSRDAGMLTRVPALWKQGRELVFTDLPLTEIADLARVALTLEDQNVRFYNIGADVVTPWQTPYGGAVFLPRWEEIQPIVAEAMAPIPEARIARTYMLVEVWNGTSNADWDLLAADRLYRVGFLAVVGEPDRHDYAETQLIIFSKQVKGSGAGYLQQVFGIPDDQVIHQPGESSTYGFRLVLGADYETCPEP